MVVSQPHHCYGQLLCQPLQVRAFILNLEGKASLIAIFLFPERCRLWWNFIRVGEGLSRVQRLAKLMIDMIRERLEE